VTAPAVRREHLLAARRTATGGRPSRRPAAGRVDDMNDAFAANERQESIRTVLTFDR
jgi:hypothetical protein